MERTNDACQHGRYDRCHDFHIGGVNTHGTRRIFALTNRDQVMAHSGFANKPGYPQHDEEYAKSDNHVIDFLAKDHPCPANIQWQTDTA